MSAVSISLMSGVATAACESCGRSASVLTHDRGVLASEVREFLELHWTCEPESSSRPDARG